MYEFFKECKECKPPKRHARCHTNCKSYLKSKKIYEEKKSEHNIDKIFNNYCADNRLERQY